MTASIAEIDQRLADVTKAWLQDHPAQRGRTITQDDVDEIAGRLAEAQVPVTYRAIHQVYGSGSPNVITPMLRHTWASGALARRLARAAGAPEVPPALMKLWDAALQAADKAAHIRHQAERDDIDAARGALEARETALMQRELRLEERLMEQEARLSDALNSLAVARRDQEAATENNKALKAESAKARSETEVARAEAQETRERVTAVEEALAASRERANRLLADAERHKELLESEKRRAEQLATQLTEVQRDTKAAQERNTALVLERSTLQLDYNELRSKLEQEQAKVTASVKRLEQLEGDLESNKQALESVRTDRDALQTAYDVRGHDVVRHQNQIAQLRAAVAQHEKREAELRAVKEELRLMTRERDQLLRHPPGVTERLQAIEALLLGR